MSDPTPAQTNPLFNLRDVRFAYEPGWAVLDGLSLSINEGDFLGIIGPNGAGKSTLIHILSGWLRPEAGEALFSGRAISEWPRTELARQIAVVPQREEGVFPFTVEEIVLMGRYPMSRGALAFEGEDDRQIAREAIEAAGLGGLAGRPVSQLSGGERQRVLMARALAQKPRV